jgi:hypothetical protein
MILLPRLGDIDSLLFLLGLRNWRGGLRGDGRGSVAEGDQQEDEREYSSIHVEPRGMLTLGGASRKGG